MTRLPPIASYLPWLALGLLCIAGCTGKQGNGGGAGGSSAERIENVAWRIAEIDGRPVQAPDAPLSLMLWTMDGRVAGFGGINRFSGPYELRGRDLSFGPAIMTRMAGPPELMDQEMALAQALEATAAWRPAGEGAIELLDDGGAVLMRLEAE